MSLWLQGDAGVPGLVGMGGPKGDRVWVVVAILYIRFLWRNRARAYGSTKLKTINNMHIWCVHKMASVAAHAVDATDRNDANDHV